MKKAKSCAEKIPFIQDIARKAFRKYHNILLKNKKFDVYFEPNFIPIDIQAKKIVTTVHDFSFHLFPEWHPKDRINYFRNNFYKQIYKSDLIITDSNYVKEETKQFLKINDDKIRVIFMGYDKTVFKKNNKDEIIRFRHFKELPERFILFVGSIEPRKNLISLLKAYLLLPEYIKRDFTLLLVGFKGWKNADILDLLNNLKGNVEYLGSVDTDELACLYRKASCFVYPSLYEGFGLPPLEAMACGCPVIVSNAASLPEVCDDAAYYVDQYNVESIADGIHKVLTDETLRQDMIRKGLERAKLFSWEKSAKEHIKVFEEVLGS